MRSSSVSWRSSSSGSSHWNSSFIALPLAGAFIVASRLNALDDHRQPLTHAYAQADGGIAAVPALQLARGGNGQTRAGAAQRVADRDRTAVGVDARIVERHVHDLEAAEHLRGEGLVDFDDVH